MHQFLIAEAARFLGVSDDTVRRWLDAKRLPLEHDRLGRMVIDGAVLATFARNNARPMPDPTRPLACSARNRFVGLISDIIADTVMTQVEVQCGPHRVISLMSTEAADELGLTTGSLVVAVVKATQIIIETPDHTARVHI